jgi:hypothetical protein
MLTVDADNAAKMDTHFLIAGETPTHLAEFLTGTAARRMARRLLRVRASGPRPGGMLGAADLARQSGEGDRWI